MFDSFKEIILKIPVSRELTLADLKIILERWFLVKKNLTIKDFLILTSKLVIYITFIFLVSSGVASTIIALAYLYHLPYKEAVTIPIFLIGLFFILKWILWYLYDYLRSWITFYYKWGTIEFWEIGFFWFKKNLNKWIMLLDEIYEKIISPTKTGLKNYVFISILIFLFFFLFIKWGMYICFGFLVWVLLLFISKIIFQSFHPLYAFGNLWEKIQKFTPEIEEQSKFIQSNFKKEQNFNILSEGFDSLSTTFSKIIVLVIKLEHVEKKANKWNLFDSTKYINSLRSDIVEPLKQLKSFLEKQREELLFSQNELQRIKVQVGADPSFHSGWQEHTELASKRTEPLLRELSENIEKLDTMIQKMSS
jgi:hypothetical protein